MRAGRPSRQAIHDRLEARVRELRERLGGLPLPEESESIWTEIWHQEAHNSTALEGNTLVLKQVAQLLDEGKAVGAKELREYMEVTGYAKAAKWVYAEAHRPRAHTSAPLLTIQEVRNVHYLAMGDVWAHAPHPDAYPTETPGNWRQHDIQRFPTGMRPPTHPLVPAEIDSWVRDADKMRKPDVRIAERLAVLHSRFERIHPFLDGNGRTGRLLMNLLLVRLGHPPVIIYKKQRAAYLRALARADRGDAGDLGELLARAILDNLMRFILPAVAGDVKLLPLEALARKDLSVTALRAAARRGALRATKESDGIWVSSRQWVREYREGRYSGLRRARKR